jgi:HD-like signal output (HDOD) protein
MAITNLKNQIQNIINLPALPSITMEIIGIIDNPDTNVISLSKIIAKDQVLASKVLKVANSPFYSYPRIISTIDFAITILGFETVKEIVLSVSYINYFKIYKIKVFDIHKFWTHSIISSVICREIAKSINYKIVGEAFVAGLIHDIGIFIMSQFYQKEFKELIERVEIDGIDLISVEKDIYGFTHEEIGSWLLERWNFPVQLVESISLHHHPEFAKINPILTSLLYYTEYLTMKTELSNYNCEKKLVFLPDYLPSLGLRSFKEIEEIYEKNKVMIETEIEKAKFFS